MPIYNQMNIFNVINQSSNLTEHDLKLMVEACKKQLIEHAAPVLGRLPWEIKIGGNDGFPVVVLDDSDQAQALGYHTQDPNGKIWCRVFTNPILKRGGTALQGSNSVSVVLSHEILETFYNPYVNLWSNRGDETFVAVEICDPVERQSYEIEVEGTKVSVSNFVLEAWFDKEMINAGRYDYLSKLTKPLEVAHGGYNVIFNSGTGEVKPVFNSTLDEEEHSQFKPSHPASRSNRNKEKIMHKIS